MKEIFKNLNWLVTAELNTRLLIDLYNDLENELDDVLRNKLKNGITNEFYWELEDSIRIELKMI
jgi:hypothetical protein